MKHNRRSFIKLFAAMSGGVLLLPSCKGGIDPWFRFLTAAEAKCIIALCEQIIPADKDPGATDAGVVYYIDNQLGRYLSDKLPVYRKAIATLQALVMEENNMRFEELSPDTQVGIMKKMEQNNYYPDKWEETSSSQFMRMLVQHTMQGFYGPPRYGGNKDFVSYRILKLDYPLLIGQNRYNG